MRTLRDLLTTWKNWSARNTLIHALSQATADDARETTEPRSDWHAEVTVLDALRDAAELSALLNG